MCLRFIISATVWLKFETGGTFLPQTLPVREGVRGNTTLMGSVRLSVDCAKVVRARARKLRNVEDLEVSIFYSVNDVTSYFRFPANCV